VTVAARALSPGMPEPCGVDTDADTDLPAGIIAR
jgi:hypothetical protein